MHSADTNTLPETAEAAADGGGQPRPWRPATRIAFRFCFVYFGLFCLWFGQTTFAFTGVLAHWLPERAVLWQMIVLAPAARWAGRHVFGVDVQLHVDSGSGDQPIIWVMAFCGLVIALVVTAVWTVLDRHRTDYARLSAWFLTAIRLCVGGQLLFYGTAKVIPIQMPAPPLPSLLQPYGEFSPLTVLWLQVGTSYPYEILLGSVELIAGMLLFVPRTATLGTLLGLASMAQIFVLNMTFDVPVKLLSFHLLVMTLLLLAPQLRRLADLLVLERSSAPLVQPRLFTSARANRAATAVQVALGVWVLIGCMVVNWHAWYEYGDGRPKPDLYGIWSVTEFTVDGVLRPSLMTDEERWQRVVFDHPDVLVYQQMTGELIPVPAEIDDAAGTIDLFAAPSGTLTYQRPQPGLLRFDGQLDGRELTMTLERIDLSEFPLHDRDFNWVQEYPYFR